MIFVYNNYVKDGTSYTYTSDIDILIIFRNQKPQSNLNLKSTIENEVQRRNLNKRHALSIIIEPIKRVNKLLEEGHFFFFDIKKEVILLFQEKEKYQLKEPKELSNEDKKEVFEKHFEVWFKSGEGFLMQCNHAIKDKNYNIAAFELHQATEGFLSCALLVLTDYKPKTHKLDLLIKLCSSQNHQFLRIFPQATKSEIECFKLLNSAYINARYEADYKITKEQLEYLIERVEQLKKTTKQVCKEKINSF